jgi:SOS-response transcriptional repressor LexA
MALPHNVTLQYFQRLIVNIGHNMSNWTGRLKSKMKELGLTQEELANKLGVTRSAVAHYVQGTRHPPLRQVINLAAILKVNPAWLQFGKDQDTPVSSSQHSGKTSNRIPILDWHQARDFHSKSSKDKQSYLEYFNRSQNDCYALLIKGDSMVSPMGQGVSFNPGNYVVIDPDKSPTHGNFVITAASKNKETVLRQYVEEGGIVYLKPLNPQYPLMHLERGTKIVGVVVASINFTL